jgi:thioredoxin 1
MKRNFTTIAHIDEMSFESEVLESTTPVLVAFLAAWSQPCLVMRSVLDQVATCCGKETKVVQTEADDCLNLSLIYDIQSIPTLLLFSHGQVCFRIVGTATKEAIIKQIKSFVPTVGFCR